MLALRKRRRLAQEELLERLAEEERARKAAAREAAKKRRVVVVGAGLAGLAAGVELQKLGWTVVVAEARERVGGRCASAMVGGASVDVGASWIHGIRRNPLYNLCCGCGLSVFDTGAFTRLVYGNGLSVAAADDAAAEARFNEALEAARKRGETAASSEAGGRPNWWHACDLALGPVLDEALRTCEDRVQRVCEWHKANLCYANGAPSEELSLRHWDIDEANSFEGAHCVVREGLGAVAARLAADLDVRFGFRASEIRHGQTSCEVVAVDGRSLPADYVVVTVPLGVLKESELRFEPPLPEFKRRAIRELGFGTLDKTVVVFESRFWPHDALPLGVVDDATYFLFIDLTPCLGRAVVVALTPATGGRAAIADGGRRCARVLASALGCREHAVQAATSTCWRDDPLARGSYTFLRPGSTPAHVLAMSAPAGRVRFAGEACSVEHLATAAGALLSGQSEARRLHRFARGRCPDERDYFFRDDKAACAVCGRSGEDASVDTPRGRFEAGHLVRVAGWIVHEGCAVGSPDVDRLDGDYFGVDRAVRRGMRTRCAKCDQLGATLSCVKQDCSRSFHLKCAAIEAGFDFCNWRYRDDEDVVFASRSRDAYELSDSDDDSDADCEQVDFACSQHRPPPARSPPRPRHSSHRRRPRRRPPRATRGALRAGAGVVFHPTLSCALDVAGLRSPREVSPESSSSSFPPFLISGGGGGEPGTTPGTLVPPRHVLLELQ